MAQFTVNQQRIDVYFAFKFLLFFEGRPDPVAGVSKISPLKRTTEVVSHRDGGDLSTPRHAPGASKFEPVTFERGLTHDPDFEQWANLVYSTDGDAAVSLAGYKRNLSIQVNDNQGGAIRRYHLYRAWVSEYTATGELDANANAVLIESIVVQYEGFERDLALVERVET
jgi:phage tail-like protein